MKNIIFLTFLNLWSMEKNKGAPSFYKTIEGYVKDEWNVILISPKSGKGITPKTYGVRNITYKPLFYIFTKIKKISFFGRILNNLYGNHMLYRLGREALKKFDSPAIIYAYEVNGVHAGKRLAEEFALPLVTRFQGTVLAPMENTQMNRLKMYPHFHALETLADITIMTDDGTQGDVVLKRLNNQSTQVLFLKNGVDLSFDAGDNEKATQRIREKLDLSQSDEVLMTVSRLASWKKVSRAIDAFQVVSRERPNCKLVIVGDGDSKEALVKQVQNLGLSFYVIFVGAIPQVEVKNYLEIADIFLSLYDLSNVGNPLLEAMSCGKPIITLNVGDTAKLIKNEENGIILNVDQLDKIPSYIQKLLGDKVYAGEMGRHAKEYAKCNFWTWDERIQAELSVVNTLIDN